MCYVNGRGLTLTDPPRTSTIENRAGQKRQIAIGIPKLSNGRVLRPRDLREAQDGARLHLATIPARAEQVETVVVEEGRMRQVGLTVAALDALLEPTEIPETEKTILRSVLPTLKEAEALQAEFEAVTGERNRIDARVQRQRVNLQAVPSGAGDSSAVNGMLKDLLAMEEEIREGEERQRKLSAAKELLMKQVREALSALSRTNA